MSTSPSWFDQEKLSRLVKKVGTKTVTELPHVQLGDAENRPPAENLASTARISLVSKPPSLLADQRALPALPRRTGALPSIKALFEKNNAAASVPETTPAPEPARAMEMGHGSQEAQVVIPSGQEEEDLSEIWHKMSLLNEELAKTVLERDQAQAETAELREQLQRADELLNAEKEPPEKSSEPTASSEELETARKEAASAKEELTSSNRALTLLKDESAHAQKALESSKEEVTRISKEREEMIAERDSLRAQLLQSKDAEKQKSTVDEAAGTQQIEMLTNERDQARRQYADLRTRYETLKQEQAPKEETIKFRKEWEQQMEELKGKLAERDKEIVSLKAVGSGDDKLKQEAASLREQLAKLKDEASVAQRGLALSQKALQQTRDTLREATEGTSLSRHNFDNLKNECAILAQQNTVLQAQNDQLSRDLNSSKGTPNKITTRLST